VGQTSCAYDFPLKVGSTVEHLSPCTCFAPPGLARLTLQGFVVCRGGQFVYSFVSVGVLRVTHTRRAAGFLWNLPNLFLGR
jgi:hypothetical protein